MVFALIKNYKYIGMCWIGLLIYLGLFFNGYLNVLDVWGYRILIRNDYITVFMKIMSYIGSFYGISLICLICMILSFYKGKTLTIHTCCILIINQVIKQLIHRPRPSLEHMVNVGGYSFPSGHSMVSMFVFLMIAYNLKDQYRILSYIMIIIPIFIGISRIYLGVHYTTDVLAGFIFSIVYFITLIKYKNLSVT